MKIEILGTNCERCKTLVENTLQAVAMSGVDAEVVKVEDIPSIVGYGVLSMPAMVIDGRVVCSGKVPSPEEIKGILGDLFPAAGSTDRRP